MFGKILKSGILVTGAMYALLAGCELLFEIHEEAEAKRLPNGGSTSEKGEQNEIV